MGEILDFIEEFFMNGEVDFDENGKFKKRILCKFHGCGSLKPHVTVIVAYYHSVESICMLFAVSAVNYPMSQKMTVKFLSIKK